MSKKIAVLDVGKTNKKLLVFDENLKVLDSIYENIPADESGPIHFEKMDEMSEWFLNGLAELASKHDVGAVSVTTHGATFAALGADGKLSAPLIAYTTDPGDDFNNAFFEKYGDRSELHGKLLTPLLGGLANIARGIEFLREKYPAEFAATDKFLFFPQYFGHLLTGVAGADSTYAGCHTYLWNFEKNDWSFVADKMGIRGKLPAKIAGSAEILGTVTPAVSDRTGLSQDTIVTYGVHDSNASLVPYLIKNKGRFILNSTGTWCVEMCPAEKAELTQADMDAGVFYNLSVFFQPVKTAIFMGGAERDLYADILKRIDPSKGFLDFDPGVYERVLNDAKLFITPGVLPGTGPFPDSVSRVIDGGTEIPADSIPGGDDIPESPRDAKYAYAAVNASLAIQTGEMLKSVGAADGVKIYIEGGFRKNKGYQACLSSLFPGCELVLSDIPEATAFGAALLGKSALEKRGLEELDGDFEIETTTVERHSFAGMDAYAAKLREFAAGKTV
ncbi:MAG: carbohydrate kinase [Kiritimatiellaeota bacterium]|nr:carbohydrate kinase [Kiritimatiellota bacterium]